MTTNWKLGLGFSLITVIMWGFLPLALKGVLGSMDPVTISWYRFSLSALIAVLWYGHQSVPSLRSMLSPSHLRLSLVAVFGLIGNYLLYVWGLDYINPAATQILIQLAPLLLLVASVVIFKERFSALQWIGVACFSFGMLLFFHQRLNNAVLTSDAYVTGVALVIAAAILWSIYGLAQKQLLLHFHAKDILLLICLGGTILLLPLAEPQQIMNLTRPELGLLAFSGINTIVAYGCFGLALSYWQVSRVSAILPLAPLLTLLFTFLLNHWELADIPTEALDWLAYFGALMVVGGSAVAALPNRN